MAKQKNVNKNKKKNKRKLSYQSVTDLQTTQKPTHSLTHSYMSRNIDYNNGNHKSNDIEIEWAAYHQWPFKSRCVCYLITKSRSKRY